MLRTIKDGKELKQAIVDYIVAILPSKQFTLVLIIGIPILIVVGLITLYESFLTYYIAFMFLVGSIKFIYDHFENDTTFFKLKKVLDLIEFGICYHGINDESKYCIVEFFIPAKNMIHDSINTREHIKETIIALMPHYANYKFQVSCYTIPNIVLDSNNSKIYTELEKLVEQEINRSSSHLPIDIKGKGKEMSKAYLMLYCVENTLRLFIEDKSKQLSNPLFLSNSVKKKILDRKGNEAQNKYLSVRGNSDLFYLDFKELGDVIVNNPHLLSFFPNDLWVKVKIEELGNIRNLIAHNSFIGELETQIIAVNYESILKQIEK